MRFILAILLSICFSTASYSQELLRLRDLADTSAATYPYIRCGAMYQAIMERTGIDRMGEASWQQTEEMRMLLFMIAGLILQSELPNVSTNEIGNITARDGRRIADLYEKRMNNNYAASGQAFGGDPVIGDDLDYCKLLYDQTLSVFSGN